MRRSANERTSLDAKGQDHMRAAQEAHNAPVQQQNNVVTSLTQYLLHNVDGMTFNTRLASRDIGTRGCKGQDHCQFATFDEARLHCNSITACTGVLQENEESSDKCLGGFGCFFLGAGQLHFDQKWIFSTGKTFERQVLQYMHLQDGRKFSEMFQVGTRNCPGVKYCQFQQLHPALAFCDLDRKCMGVMKMKASGNHSCDGEKGCYMPAKGDVQHDPLWLSQSGETYMKQQEVAYTLRTQEGNVYDGRYPRGTSGCEGVHNCQFQSLVAAEIYCNAVPTCKGVLEHMPQPDGNPACTGGLGCFEPCKGKLKYNAMFMVTEGKLYERRIVR